MRIFPASPTCLPSSGGLGEATIPELAAASADRVPGQVAVTIDGEPVTHAELDAGAARVAGFGWPSGSAPATAAAVRK